MDVWECAVGMVLFARESGQHPGHVLSGPAGVGEMRRPIHVTFAGGVLLAARTPPLFWIEVAMAHNCSKKCVISGSDPALSWAKVGDRRCHAFQRGLAGTWQK